MRTDDFDYELPERYIAQKPAVPRDSCKLMVVRREDEGCDEGSVGHADDAATAGALIEHRVFREIGDFLHPGDLLVVNETRVLPARLFGRKAVTGARVETLLLDKVPSAVDSAEEQTWNCLVRPGKRLKVGAQIEYAPEEPEQAIDVTLREDDGDLFAGGAHKAASPLLRGEVISIDKKNGSRAVRFTLPQDSVAASVDEAFHMIGHTPLPPYIKAYTGDEELYQTVYSTEERSAAAPTAGLHFTPELLESLQNAGIDLARVHLEVGLDTFRLVAEENVEDHEMHTELYSVPEETVRAIEACKARGGRVIAVGTTSVRSLESAAANGALEACERAATKLYILPGYEFKVVDAIITNFHVPRSTLMMLVSAFAGRENIMNAYEEAKRENYRFFSFGDAMLLL